MPHSTQPYGFQSSVLDHASSMLAFWDEELNCRYANRAYERWFGVEPESLQGTSIRTLLGPDLFALNEPYILKVLAGEAQTFERVVPGPDGISRHSLARYTPDVMKGKVVGFIAEVTEVTSLKQAQATLEASIAACQRAHELLKKKEADLELAQRLGQIGSWYWEIAADISTWSAQLYSIFGLDPKRLPPSYADSAKLYPPKSWAVLQAAVQGAISEGNAFCLELDFNRPDSTPGCLEVRGSADRDEQGAIVGLHGTAQDITDRQRLWAQHSFDLAASEVAARDRHKADFLAMLGHELRNTLAPVPTGLEVMRRAESKETLDRMAAMISRQVTHMSRLVDDLFDLRRLQSGELSLKSRPVSVWDVIETAVEMSFGAITKQGNRLELHRSEAGFTVQGDQMRLAQVISNLLNNAAKFTSNGGIQVATEEDGEHFVKIVITDSGIGMAADEQESIFGLYAQSGNSGEKRLAGLGIGLHLVKQLVELHGGSVSAYSAGLGLGSRFTVRLPLAPTEAE